MTRRVDSHYGTNAHKHWRDAVQERAKWRCERCKRRPRRLFSDHIVELRDGGDPLSLENGQCLCGSCHTLKTIEAKRARGQVVGGFPPYKKRKLIEYIDEHYRKKISLETLCSLVHHCKSHVVDCFWVSFGMSPHQYIGKVRVEKAKELLKGPDKLRVVASRVYSGSYHTFRYIFIRHEGMTPQKYRRTVLKQPPKNPRRRVVKRSYCYPTSPPQPRV